MRIERQAKRLPGVLAAAMPDAKAWRLLIDGAEYHAIVSRDNIAGERDIPDERWHVSVSSEDHLPPWAIFAAVVHDLRPGVPFCLAIPPRSWWVNLHEFTLHAYETRDEALIAQWREERQGDRPT